MRKLIAFFLAVLFVFGSFGSIFAGTVTEREKPMKTDITEQTREVYSGTCGDNLTWTLDTETGVLEITGTGDMANWNWNSNAPWYSYRSNIISVIIGNGVTSIGDYAFYKCTELTSVNIPDSVIKIYDYAFEGCSSLTSVAIPNSVKSIGIYTFDSCTSLTSVFIPDSVTILGECIFWRCTSLTSVIIPDSVTKIGDHAFEECTSLASVIIPNSVTEIYDYAFQECSSLTSVTIGNSVTNIHFGAFKGCTSLVSVTIPDSVTDIWWEAFKRCSSLSSAIFLGAPPSWFESEVFDDCAPDFCIYYYPEYASSWAPNGKTTWKGYPICMISGPDIEPGDLDGDGLVTMADVTLLSMYLNGENPQITEPGMANADANEDGTVDIRDIAAIYAIIAAS